MGGSSLAMVLTKQQPQFLWWKQQLGRPSACCGSLGLCCLNQPVCSCCSHPGAFPGAYHRTWEETQPDVKELEGYLGASRAACLCRTHSP